MAYSPKGVRLSRAKGWRLPDGAVVVSRPGPWGNPFVVGVDGDATRCVDLYAYLLCGFINLTSKATVEAQQETFKYAQEHLSEIKGKDLACWCQIGKPCHRDVLLCAANGLIYELSSKAELKSVDGGRIERGPRHERTRRKARCQ